MSNPIRRHQRRNRINRLWKYIKQHSTKAAAELTGAVVGGAIQGPGGAVVGYFTGTAAYAALQRVVGNAAQEQMSDRQAMRMGEMIALTTERLEQLLANGDTLRSDWFPEDTQDETPVDEIAEQALHIARDETDKKKLRHYAALLAELCISEGIDKSSATTILAVAEKLNYRQLCILAIHYEDKTFSIDIPDRGTQDERLNATFLLEETAILHDLGCLYSKEPVFNNRYLFNDSLITPIGGTLYIGMHLEELDRADIEAVKSLVAATYPTETRAARKARIESEEQAKGKA